MKTLRIIGVPEHFNFPFQLLKNHQPFVDKGIEIQWIDESRGSGQMNQALRSDQADIAILLTESFLKDVEAGNPSKMIGFHVESPLNWGIHIGANAPTNNLMDLKKKHFLVSRMGSGSHLMAVVLAKREGWKADELTFEIISNMDGAREAMANGNEGIFLWEKFTTAPMVKNGSMKCIGEVPSPWPCFIMAASDRALAEFGEIIIEVRDEIYKISKTLAENPNRVKTLAEFYHLEESDVKNWLRQTQWSTAAKVSSTKLKSAMKTMKELGILQNELPFEFFLLIRELELVD